MEGVWLICPGEGGEQFEDVMSHFGGRVAH